MVINHAHFPMIIALEWELNSNTSTYLSWSSTTELGLSSDQFIVNNPSGTLGGGGVVLVGPDLGELLLSTWDSISANSLNTSLSVANSIIEIMEIHKVFDQLLFVPWYQKIYDKFFLYRLYNDPRMQPRDDVVLCFTLTLIIRLEIDKLRLHDYLPWPFNISPSKLTSLGNAFTTSSW